MFVRFQPMIVLVLAMLTYSGFLKAETYFCTADIARRFQFNKPTKTWVAAQFVVKDHKYVLALKDDKWTWTTAGKPFAYDGCSRKNKEAFSSIGAFRCEFGIHSEVLMNRNTLRFQIMSPYLYVGPFDRDEAEGADTPYIEIGRCAVVQ